MTSINLEKLIIHQLWFSPLRKQVKMKYGKNHNPRSGRRCRLLKATTQKTA